MSLETPRPPAGRLSRRPLTAARADQELFVNRQSEIEMVVSAIGLGLNVFLSGPAGSGKTSLLRQVQRRLEADGTHVAFCNLEAADTIEEAIGLLAQAIRPGEGPQPSMAGSEIDVAAIERAAADRGDASLVLLVDGVDETVTTTLFGRYRDRLWESPGLVWLAGSRRPAPAPPADAFFDRVVELRPFTEAEGEELLGTRAPWLSPQLRSRLAETIGPAQPIEWLLAAQDLALAGTDPDTALAALAAQRQAVERLPDRLRSLYRALVELGPVHAGDTELLARIAASRPWVVTAVKQLEKQGLVEARREGRRVLYQPTSTLKR